MIRDVTGNLLEADVEALVNTVNCVGFMGKGIALQFKQAFPENFRAYERAVKQGDVRPGRMLTFKTGLVTNPRFIINFPTKRHWRGNSRLEDIDAGLDALVEEIARLGVHSIAVPPLGCGNGGLDWAVVRPRIISSLGSVPDLQILLFAPVGAPEATRMPVRTKMPNMTPARAILVKLMEQYLSQAYRLTLLEIQKLSYFLQEAGEPLRLRYEAGHYGPYATNLNKVLERIEGHLIRGYGDSQKPDTEIQLLPEAPERADAYLSTSGAPRDRLKQVAELIQGFETPYGMELLSSVHWVSHHAPSARTSEEALAAVHGWNDRKRRMFRGSHIQVAWDHLSALGWLKPGRSGTGKT
jgi:O-acetyl-ADP-ribose deacetylase (regulator of RNase III)